MLHVTLKGLLAHKLRLALTALAVVLGVAFMAGSLVLTDTIRSVFDDLFAEVNAGVDAVVRKQETFEGQFGQSQRGRVTQEDLDLVESVPSVAAAEGQIAGPAALADADGELIGDPAQGAPTLAFNWSTVPELNQFTLVEGAPPEGAQVVLDKGTADTNDFAVGDTVRVLTQAGSTEFEVSGIATFGESNSLAGANIVLFETSVAQETVGKPDKFEQIAVVAADGVSQQQLVDDLSEVLPGGTEAITGDAITAENQSDVADQLGFFTTFLLIFAGIALFVGSFIIYNTFSIIVVQRSREMALLRAIGAGRRQVLGSVMLEALVVGLLASAVGIVAGIALAFGLKAALAGLGLDLPDAGTVVKSNTIVTSMIVGTVITVVAAFFPARKASKVPPIAALRDVAQDTSGSSKGRRIAGLALAVLGIGLAAKGLADEDATTLGYGLLGIFLSVATLGPVIAGPISRFLAWPIPRIKGITGVLARENAIRNPKRTASTAAALMIAVTLIGFITIFADSAKASVDKSIDENFNGDFVIDSQTFGQGGLPVAMADELNELPEVSAAAGVRLSQAQIAFGAEFIGGVDPAVIFDVVDVGEIQGDPDALEREDAVALSIDQAEEWDLGLGDTLNVRFPANDEVTEFEVVALYERPDAINVNFPLDYLFGLPAYEANVEDQYDTQVIVDLAEGVDLEDGRAAVETVTDEYPLAKVQDQNELKASQAAQINQFLALIYVLLGLAVIIAFIGIVNTLGLSIYERTRELGLMRAVGMSRKQVRTSIRWEAVIIALLGTALGLVLGIVFSFTLVTVLESQGFNTFRLPIGQLLILSVFAAGLAVLMAAWPARRAAKLNVLEAIATE
ncbi:MAG: ABC transporter permease [Acidimicrobiales bacterium]|nr:ABC transporter permease [Acidimicrobiales bacterium]